jgi:hypothetical protein
MEAVLTIFMALGIYLVFPLTVAIAVCGSCVAWTSYRKGRREKREIRLVGFEHIR